MVINKMYDNEFETKEIKFKPRIKLNHNIYNSPTLLDRSFCEFLLIVYPRIMKLYELD